jgi:hypothetical protein
VTRHTFVAVDLLTLDGHATRVEADVGGQVNRLRVHLRFDNGRGAVAHETVEIPVEFLDPSGDIRIEFTDPPPSAQEMREAGQRLIHLAEELSGDGP